MAEESNISGDIRINPIYRKVGSKSVVARIYEGAILSQRTIEPGRFLTLPVELTDMTPIGSGAVKGANVEITFDKRQGIAQDDNALMFGGSLILGNDERVYPIPFDKKRILAGVLFCRLGEKDAQWLWKFPHSKGKVCVFALDSKDVRRCGETLPLEFDSSKIGWGEIFTEVMPQR